MKTEVSQSPAQPIPLPNLLCRSFRVRDYSKIPVNVLEACTVCLRVQAHTGWTSCNSVSLATYTEDL
jgi:hypothetical protein